MPPYGYSNIDGRMTSLLPVPRWLIPSALVQWVLPRIIKRNFGVFLRLACAFDESEFAERRRTDQRGYHTFTVERLQQTQSRRRMMA